MLSIGDGIAIGCAILGAVLVVMNLASRKHNNPAHNNPSNNNPSNNKYVLQRVYDDNMQLINRQLGALNDLVTKGFEDIRGSIRGVHERVDKILSRSDE